MILQVRNVELECDEHTYLDRSGLLIVDFNALAYF